MGLFFSQFGKVADVLAVKYKTGIVTGNIEILITVDRKHFINILNVLIYVVLEW